MLSQYRLKVFQANRLPVKPVVLFKSAKIQESAAFQAAFAERLRTLTGGELERISTLIQNPAMRRAYAWFARRGISFDALAQELRRTSLRSTASPPTTMPRQSASSCS